jgi:N-acyl-D-amino-acid deacylase
MFLFWQQRYPVYDLVIQNGRVFDGERMLRWGNGVAIQRGVIQRVGFVYGLRARQRINAWGRIVAPGFIDTHVHVEQNVVARRPLRAANFVRMGVTTIITGNCGTSAKDIGRFLNELGDSGTQVNLATLVGHNTIREAVLGRSRAAPSAAQLSAMAQMVERAMLNGALGLSTGLEYAPGAFATEDEIVTLARVAAARGGIYATHIRNEGLYYSEAIEEALRTAQRAGAPLHISHLKIACPSKWVEMPSLLRRIEQARRAGQRVTQDVYVYDASSTTLNILLPVEYRVRSLIRSVIRNPDHRRKLIRAMATQLKQEGFRDYSHVRVAYSRESSLNGKTIPEIALNLPAVIPESRWRDGAFPAADVNADLRRQFEAIFYLLSRGDAQMIYFVIDENNIEAILRDPNTMIGSDSAVRSSEQVTAHPRGSGNAARFLAKFVRERRVFGWEEGLRRLTSLPAETFKIENRGRLKQGYAGDIVVFDPNRIQDHSWYDKPLDPPTGIDYVIVNGQVVVCKGEVRDVFPGHLVRPNRPLPSLAPPTQPGSGIARRTGATSKVSLKGAVGRPQSSQVADTGLKAMGRTRRSRSSGHGKVGAR